MCAALAHPRGRSTPPWLAKQNRVARPAFAQPTLLHAHAHTFPFAHPLLRRAQLGTLAYAAWIVNNRALTTTEYLGLSLSVGVYAGAVGITTGHELCHKAPWIERMSGRLLLCLVTYGHFYVEHTLGHHKDVGTDKDPATARHVAALSSPHPCPTLFFVVGLACARVRGRQKNKAEERKKEGTCETSHHTHTHTHTHTHRARARARRGSHRSRVAVAGLANPSTRSSRA